MPSEQAGLKDRPEAENLVGIYEALADMTREQVLRQFGGGQFSSFKQALADLAVAKLSPISGEMQRLQSEQGYIDTELSKGAARAREITAPIMHEVREIIGLAQD